MPNEPLLTPSAAVFPGQYISADPLRLQPRSYPFRYLHPVRWSDLQDGSRMTRIAQAQFLEDLRTVLMRDVLGPDLFASGHWKAMARAVTIEHLHAGDDQSPVELAGCIEGVGNSSYSFALAIFQRDVCLSLSKVVGVTIGSDRRPAPVPDAVRPRLAAACWPGQPAPERPQRLGAQWHALAAYRFRFDLPTRFSDTDAVGHINNVAVTRYHDNAWVAFQRACLGQVTAPGEGDYWHLSRQEVSMQGETFYPQPVTLGVTVETIADDHFDLVQSLFQDGRCNGHQRSTVAVLDASGRATPISTALRSQLARWQPEPTAMPATAAQQPLP